jgi:hypothetical protein
MSRQFTWPTATDGTFKVWTLQELGEIPKVDWI